MPIKTVGEAYRSRPDWVSREIRKTEIQAISREIRKCGAQTGLEIGVASGFSSAIIVSALAANTDDPALYSYDIAEQCYFDPTHRTGDAYFEIHSGPPKFFLTTGVISAEIRKPARRIDFAFIDADHRNPWPALDLIAVWHFLSPDAVIGLHDLEMPFKTKWRDTNGGRDLFRGWSGGKRLYDDSLNIGFLRNTDEDRMVQSTVAALRMDWERKIKPEVLMQYDHCISRFAAHNQALLRDAIEDRHKSAAAKVVRPVTKQAPQPEETPAAGRQTLNL